MSEMLSVNHDTNYNLGEGKIDSTVYVRVYNSIFSSGIVAKIGATGFTTLICLASFMDEKGNCFPSQEQVAERIGVHKNTANKYINDLLAVEINGRPIVTREKINKGQGQIYSYYTIHPLSQLAKFKGQVEEIEVNHKVKDLKDESLNTPTSDRLSTTNSDVIISTINNNQDNNIKDTVPTEQKLNSNTAIKYFQEIYREVYSVNYTVSNYGREGKLMKDKVITPYPDLAREIIEIAVRQYDRRWKSAKFPRPSVSMFSWLVNQAIEIIDEERKLTEVALNSGTLEKESEKEMLDKLSKL